MPDSLARLSFWVDYGGFGLGQVDMSGGQMALPITLVMVYKGQLIRDIV